MAQSPPELGPNPRILVIRLSALGDTLLTLPAVALLRDRFPGAHIGFLTDARHAELLDGVETIDQVLILDRLALKRARRAAIAGLWRDLLRPLVGGKWDAVIDFQSYTETAALGAMTRAGVRVGRRYKTTASWLYRPWIDAPHPETYMPFAHADTLVEAGLIADPPSTLDLYFTPSVQARTAWATTLAGLRLSPAAPRIALFVGAAREDRRWPAERFAELAMALDRQAATPPNFLVLAGPSESAVAEAVIAAGAPISDRLVRAPTASLHELAAAFSDCSMAICNDTGPLHLSIAVGTPTCGIYRRPLAHFLAPPPHRSVVAPELRVDQIPLEDVLSSVAELT